MFLRVEFSLVVQHIPFTLTFAREAAAKDFLSHGNIGQIGFKSEPEPKVLFLTYFYLSTL